MQTKPEWIKLLSIGGLGAAAILFIVGNVSVAWAALTINATTIAGDSNVQISSPSSVTIAALGGSQLVWNPATNAPDLSSLTPAFPFVSRGLDITGNVDSRTLLFNLNAKAVATSTTEVYPFGVQVYGSDASAAGVLGGRFVAWPGAVAPTYLDGLLVSAGTQSTGALSHDTTALEIKTFIQQDDPAGSSAGVYIKSPVLGGAASRSIGTNYGLNIQNQIVNSPADPSKDFAIKTFGGEVLFVGGADTIIPLALHGTVTQTADLMELSGKGGYVMAIDKSGYYVLMKNTAMPAADLSSNWATFWFDPTNGAAKFHVEGKTADGTVVDMVVPAVDASSTPASSSAPCTTGTTEWDANYTYVCVSTNTWKRAALTTW